MKNAAQDLAQLRQFFTDNTRQVRVAGVADSMAASYVRHYASKFSYAIFYGKQSKPIKHYSAKDEAQAEQRLIEALTQAGKLAKLKAEEHQKGRAPFTDLLEGKTLHRSYTTTGTAYQRSTEKSLSNREIQRHLIHICQRFERGYSLH